MIRSGGAPCRSTGAPVRLTQKVVNPKALAPMASQPLDETNAIRDVGVGTTGVAIVDGDVAMAGTSNRFVEVSSGDPRFTIPCEGRVP